MLLFGVVACVLVLAGVSKARTLPAFAGTLEHLVRLSSRPRLVLAGAIVAAELALAAALVSGSTRRLASGLAVLLFGSFTSVSVISARRRLVVPCACFGPSRSHLGWGTAARSIVLVAYALLIMFGAPAATPQSTLVYESFGAAALLLTPFIVGSAVDLWIGARDVLGESG